VIEGGMEGPLVVKKWGQAMDSLVIAWIILWRTLLGVAPESAKLNNSLPSFILLH
jgi:hypothetical protein